MTPAEFLALTQTTAKPDEGRRYRALVEGVNETFLTLHLIDGKFHSPPYAHLGFITGDDCGGTLIRLVFKLPVIIRGRGLQSVFEAIRARRAAHLYEFDEGKYDPPEVGQSLVTSIAFEVEEMRAPAGRA